jgi:hypothetical protein
MATLFKHFESDTWAYYSPFAKVSPNTYVIKDTRKLYIGGPGIKAEFKIDGLPVGTKITVDEEETNPDLGYFRIYKCPDIAGLIPSHVTAFLKEHYPSAPEVWQVWADWGGCSVYVDPVPEPDPLPDPGPQPDPQAKEIATEFELLGWTVTVWRYI